MTIIDGKLTAATIKQEIAQIVAQRLEQGLRRPHLAAILVGHDGGSETYVANKVKACEACGFTSTVIRREDTVTEAELLDIIAQLNADPEVDGFIVQLPLPRHINEQRVTEAVDFRKDVDGFHPINVGRQSLGMPCFHSATPAGIVELLRRYHVPTRGRNCVIIGRSNIVGKPLASLMMQKGVDATVTVCHSATENLKEVCSRADILVAALGRPGFVTADMVKEGATVIDVGTTRVIDTSRKSGYRLSGDVDYENVAPKCEFITPVPGGVGPMTICMLMLNTLKAATGELFA
ncbi:MAG: bifunctional 5,10-methylenetetrahydrofolate dehydrogenase/5,10-methenyltetrahydrofolate cyclohydrolase [Muribaculaceae bacterium]